ncbi:MAG TPA: NnrU family protein [Anaeromyxobacteraceae bacterium]|nr:NnrU family protein [Anaeromyxobacteraceae bacterium]
MALLILGLVVFLGVHSTRIISDGWRSEMVARLGLNPWKGIYSAISIAGFVLILWGYGLAGTAAVPLWSPPAWTAHLAAALTVPAFILLAATYVPRNQIKAAVHHPMVLGVQLWALAHLLANGTRPAVLLFGAFLAWALLSYVAARRRDRAEGHTYPAGRPAMTLVAVAAGVGSWAAFALWLHGRWIGVAPLG